MFDKFSKTALLGLSLWLVTASYAANEFFTATGVPSTSSAVTSSSIRAEFAAIDAGFTKLPTMLGSGNYYVIVNPSGTALTTIATPALATTVTTNANLTGGVTSVGNAATVVTNANLTGGVTSVGNAATVITNANLTGDVTSVGNATTLTNAPVIAKVLTGYVSGAGTVAATDSILQAIQKLNGNNATNANLTGGVTSVGNAATVITNANLTGDVTSVGNATTLTNAPVIAKVLTGYTSGAGTVAATDSILQAIQKLNGNKATNANMTGPITGTGNVTSITSQTGTGTTFVMSAGPTLTGTTTTSVLTTTGQLNLTGNLIQARSDVGAEAYFQVSNTDNTNAGSNANLYVVSGGASGGDPYATFYINGVSSTSIGLDNSDLDKFKISMFGSLGTNDALTITQGGLVEITTGLSITGGTSASGMWYGPANGLQIKGATGSSYDFVLFNQAVTTRLIDNPTGTSHLNFGGSTGRGVPVGKTADFTIAATENWIISNRAATNTVTLPAAASFSGREIMIKTIQAFTVVSASSNVVPLIGGAAGTAILAATAGKWATLVSDGTQWQIMQGN